MSRGRFGEHGGQYIPETLMNAVIELEEAYNRYKDDADFQILDVVDEASEFGRGGAHGGGAEIALHAAAQIHGLAHVDDGAGAVAVEIAPGFLGQMLEFLAQDVVHGGSWEAWGLWDGGAWPHPSPFGGREQASKRPALPQLKWMRGSMSM